MRSLLALLLLTPSVFAADPAPEAPKLAAPQAPARAKPVLETISDLTLDMSRIVIFLERGQAYFKAYAKGTHTPAENKAFVKFLEDYERLLGDLKTENEALKAWIEKKAELKAE